MAILARGLDAATILTPYAKTIADHGFASAGRYLKSLTRGEIAALHAAGLSVWLIFETTADRALGGAAAGREDGARALKQAQALGAPAGTAIYLTVDTSAGKNTDADRDGIADAKEAADYFLAAKSMLYGTYRGGDYADGDVLSTLGAAVEFPWEPGAMGWSGSRAYDATAAWALKQGPQINAGRTATWAGLSWPALPFAYDPNVIARDIGAWGPPGAAPAAQASAPAVPQPSSPAVDPIALPSAADLQRALKAEGLYAGEVDGLWGPRSQAALAAHYAR